MSTVTCKGLYYTRAPQNDSQPLTTPPAQRMGPVIEPSLASKKCIPCRGGVPPLKGEALQNLYQQLGNGWKVVAEHHLEKEFIFKNFREGLTFTNQVGELAEAEGHHPDIHLAWGKVKIVTWTHKIDGLSESDFILAAKIDSLKSNS